MNITFQTIFDRRRVKWYYKSPSKHEIRRWRLGMLRWQSLFRPEPFGNWLSAIDFRYQTALCGKKK